MFNLFRRASPTRFRASLYSNADFYCFRTISGIDIGVVDPDVNPIILEPSATNEELSQALFSSLLKSRSPKWGGFRGDPELYNFRNIEKAYKEWRSQMMKTYGYKTQRKMFENMKLLDFEYKRYEFTISVETLVQEKPQAWMPSKIQTKVNLSSKLEPAILGEKIRHLSQT